MKKLYLISGDTSDCCMYEGAVVCAENEQQAKETHPSGDNGEWVNRCSWVKDPSEVQVRYLGVADESVSLGVVLDSYSEG